MAWGRPSGGYDCSLGDQQGSPGCTTGDTQAGLYCLVGAANPPPTGSVELDLLLIWEADPSVWTSRRFPAEPWAT